MTATLPVRPDGKISLPLLNDVQAAGLTPMQLADSLTARLKKYVADPRVTVVVTQINSKRVYLVGEVLHPGPLPMLPNMENVGTMPMGAMPTFSTQVSADTLLARCAQGNWNPDPKTMLFVGGDEQKTGTEEFRTLRSRLYGMRENGSLKKLLITSALPKEGKSFVAVNLAQVLVRQHGRRVLLIDGDLRGPRLHQAFGTESSPGLVNFLTGESDEFSIIQRGPIENLYFLPAGRSVSNAPELVSNGRLKMLLQRVEPLFDWIIIDSPPAVPVADASQLAKLCDGVLMVVRSNVTPIDMLLKDPKERLRFEGAAAATAARYDWPAIGERFSDVLARVAGNEMSAALPEAVPALGRGNS